MSVFEISTRKKTSCTRTLQFVLNFPEQNKYWAEYERRDVKSCGGMGWGGKDLVAHLN